MSLAADHFTHGLKQMLCYCDWLCFTGAADRTAEYLPTGEKARDAFWQTCGAGVLPDLRDKTKAAFERFDRATRFFQRFSGGLRRRGLVAYLVMAVGFAQIVAKFAVGRMSASDFEWVYEISWRRNRRIVRTTDGYLGMVPMRVDAGDKVGLFQGCRVPLVVRRVETADDNGEKWRVIGDAYIHGIMMGEKWDEGRCRDFWFE